jgi:ABC-type polysaccharide/polyol phosphate export systems, permease component
MRKSECGYVVIEAGSSSKQYWLDVWRYRELFAFLAWRDILVRYKQTAIGVAWSVIRPVITMVVFTVVFGNLAKLPSDGVPYPILVYSAMLPWQFFANNLNDVSNSLITNANLISKVYFPRLIIPVSTIIVNLFDIVISLAILFALLFWYDFTLNWTLVLLPLFLLLTILVSLGAGLWLAALNVKYRDFRYLIPFIVQIGLYISPVGFSSNVVPEQWRMIYSANPMVGIIDGFRWAIIGGNTQIFWPGILISVIIVLVLFLTGLSYFRKAEKEFADII